MTAPSGSVPNEIIHCRPKLRADVRSYLQSSGNQPYYQLEDPLVARFYRLGPREWKVASQFQGTTSLGEFLRGAPRESSSSELGQQDILMLCRWLVQMQLLEPDARLQATWPVPTKPTAKVTKWLANPVFLKFPLFNP